MEPEKSRELLRQWMKVLDSTEKIYDRFIKRFHLNKNAFFALDYLNSHSEGEEPAGLAGALGVTRQMMTIVLNDLDGRGFILRRERQDDHRRKTILLTKSGKATADEVCRALEDFDIAALSGFPDEEIHNMLAFSTRFHERLKIQWEASAFAEESDVK